MNKRIVAVPLVLFMLAFLLRPISGVGQEIVYDPTNYANALIMLAELIKSYEQLKAQYELEFNNLRVVPVDMWSRYRTLGAPWLGLQLAADRFGNLGVWLRAVNGGGSALGGYNGASISLEQYGPRVSQLAPEEQVKAASQYASEELADGSNVHSLETIGMLRANAPAVEQAISGLERDSLSLDPAMNTEVAILNKMNAAAIAGLRSTRDTNTLLLNTLEQQVVASKRQREAEVSEINAKIARIEHGDEAKAEHTRTLTESLRAFRWQ